MENKSFFQEFKDMLFKYKVLYIVLGFIAYLLIMSFVVKDSPIQYFDFNYTEPTMEEKIKELRPEYYGMGLKEALQYNYEKIVEIQGYDDEEFKEVSLRLMDLYQTRSQIIIKNIINGTNDPIPPEIDQEIISLEKEYDQMYFHIAQGFSEEQEIEISARRILIKEISEQISYTGIDEFKNLWAENLFLGRGRFFKKDRAFMALMNFLGLEIALGLIANFYIRKSKDSNKKQKLGSFILISLLMAGLIVIKQLIITKINYPRAFENVPMAGIIYNDANFTFNSFLGMMALTWIIYYIARPIIYAKRAENYTQQRSLLSFIIFNGLMYFVYFNINIGTFVSLLGDGVADVTDVSMGVLSILIVVAGLSLRSYLKGKPVIKKEEVKEE